jgi:hypothetical protein
MTMTDFLQAIADHLNAEPTICPCGHPSVLHVERFGCSARWEHDSGSDVCDCEEGRGGARTDERPQAAYGRAVEASIVHEATHSQPWRLPCRTCRELHEAALAALDAVRRSR